MNIQRRRLDAPGRALSLAVSTALVFSSLLTAPAFGQSETSEANSASATNAASATNWRVIVLPQVDLWYHGLATAGLQGLGPYDLYEPGYAARLNVSKAEAQTAPTAFDDRVAGFGSALARDPAFEVFHFVPLYFASSAVEPMLGALEVVGAAEGAPAAVDVLARFGANAVAGTISRPDQRAVLTDWTSALRAEWDGFFADYWRELAVRNASHLQSIQAEWNDQFAPHLAAYLKEYRLDGGVLVLSDPVGPEGRIFEGVPGNRSDNIVVVGFDEDAGPRAPLYAAVRELCFPLVREVLAGQPVAANRASSASRSSTAAVRCGAYLLDRFAPELAPGYRSSFTRNASGDPAQVTAAFDRKYATDAALDAAMQNRLGAIPGR
ncbi:MAG: hypothetical protein ABFS14_10660 [Gemmatimonadota bacterium]